MHLATAKKKKRSTDTILTIQDSIFHHIRYSLGKHWDNISEQDLFTAVALSVRDRMIDGMLETEERYEKSKAKHLYYLSMEFLMGRSLGNNLFNLGIFDLCREAFIKMGYDLEEIRQTELDAALGNGGLGRLAACFLDSMASLGLPGYGYGINYEYGLFKQVIYNGHQREKPDNWLAYPTPWEIERPDEACLIPVYGRMEHAEDMNGQYNPLWMDWKLLIGVPHDMPIVGYGGRTINYLRLYSSRSSQEFDMQIFNGGDYLKAVEQKMTSETISKVLYPSDSIDAGKELRLIQEYFLVACSLRDIVRKYQKNHNTFEAFPSKVAIQLNDTHPALTVTELMRILVDENDLPWEKSWEITQATLGYTNHTLLPEALEKWPIPLLEYVLPRHLQFIYEINQRFLDKVVELWPDDSEKISKMSIIEEGDPKQARMANLAIIGSHSINGVSALHSELVKTDLVPEFYKLWPERFNNKTNGVTQRRWLLKANPELADLLTDKLNAGWITDLEQLKELDAYIDDENFQKEFMAIKRANKERLADIINKSLRVTVNPDSLFDIQIKRIHEYKRQLLNVMHIIHDYLNLIEDNKPPLVPYTYIFAGKAAPGYWAAKQTIKLINNVGDVINNDPRAQDHIKVIFLPDYRVSLAEKIIPACDLSEQISTAGMEASGTGNMKLAMNGALTIGTLDGANIEIMEEVGEDNIFIFGLKTEEVNGMRQQGSYNPREYYERDHNIRRVMDSFRLNTFCEKEPELFAWIYYSVLEEGDRYFHLADLASYIEAHEKARQTYKNKTDWARKAILNVARSGKFSSDRTISEYAKDIWGIHSY